MSEGMERIPTNVITPTQPPIESVVSIVPEQKLQLEPSQSRPDPHSGFFRMAFNKVRDIFGKPTQPDVAIDSVDNAMQKQMTRRTFLKTAVGAAATIATMRSASNMIPRETEFNPEGLQYIDNTIFLDFAPETPIQGIQQSEYPNNAQLEKRLLGENYRSPIQLMQEFGIDFVRKGFQKSEFFKALLKKHPQFGLLHGGLENFSNHGEIVTTAHRKALAQFGYDAQPTIAPIQSALTGESSGLEYTDKLGNKGVTIEVIADPLIEQLQNTDQKIVSMSFQLGKIHLVNVEKDLLIHYDLNKHQELLKQQGENLHMEEAIYINKVNDFYLFDRKGLKLKHSVKDGDLEYTVVDELTGKEATEGFRKMNKQEYENYQEKQELQIYKQCHSIEEKNNQETDIKIKGAYSGKEGEENIQELFKLVNAVQDKLFIVAAGNYSDDIRPLREKFKDNWPKNLIIVGQWNKDENRPKADKGTTLGADIYVDNKDFGFEDDRKFSSISTASLSAVANILAQQGLTNEQIKTRLFELTSQVEFKTDYVDSLAFEPIDLDKYIADIGISSNETARVFNFPLFKQQYSKAG